MTTFEVTKESNNEETFGEVREATSRTKRASL